MRRNRGGFTILEVMIFLAISGAMLVAAMAAIKGQQNRTEFTQGMRDTDSKLQDILNDVSTGNFSFNDSDCNAGGGRPNLTGSGGKGIGSRSDCLFLGEAVQFSTKAPDNSRFAIYTVLGSRLITKGFGGTPVSVSSFDEANPTAMISPAANKNLTAYYDYEQGITATHLYYTPAGSAAQTDKIYSLIGIYSGFTSAGDNIGNSSADGAQSIMAYAYKLPDATSYANNGNPSAKKCIDDNDPNPVGNCPFDTTLSAGGSKGFAICFDSNNGTGQTALITIYNSVQGVSTRLEFNPDGICPAS